MSINQGDATLSRIISDNSDIYDISDKFGLSNSRQFRLTEPYIFEHHVYLRVLSTIQRVRKQESSINEKSG
ncbi:MAG: hypothetical protein U7127_20785 [Phormidium sp.]